MFFLTRLTLAFLLFLVLPLFGLMLAALESNSALDAEAPPSPADVVEAREFIRDLRAAVTPESPELSTFVTTEKKLNTILKLASRFIPEMRANVEVNYEEVTGVVSVPVPRIGKWINVYGSAPEFEGDFSITSFRVGRLAIPPKLSLKTLRMFANLFSGEQLGDTLIEGARSMKIDGKNLEFQLMFTEMGSNGVMTGIFGALRGNKGPDVAKIDYFYGKIRHAMENGNLPLEGSYLPYIKFTLQLALSDQKIVETNDAYTSAIVALSLICGAKDFSLVVGNITNVEIANEAVRAPKCSNLTLNGRADTRRHFTTAAALQALSNRGISVSIGEFKELYDIVKSGGFDFTDLAANNSGIRMSDRLMAASKFEWEHLKGRMNSESDIIISFDQLPEIMDGAVFEAKFGDIDSVEYTEVLSYIERLIDDLPLYND